MTMPLWLEMLERFALASILSLAAFAALAMASDLAGGLLQALPIVGGCNMSIEQIV